MRKLPPWLMTSEKGSFARDTIQNRKPLIIDRILSHYDYTPIIRKNLLAFKNELTLKPIQSLFEETSDRFIWDQDVHPWLGKTWLEIPWFFAETYFYRRVLEIVRYFQPGPWMSVDPYHILKQDEIYYALPVINESYHVEETSASYEHFSGYCYRALWGNRGDLSNLHVFETDMGLQPENIILDQSEAAYRFLRKKPMKIAYFMDNVGKELYFDLAFIDYLLNANLAKSVTIFLKNQPFFVSDAMPKDILFSLRAMQTSSAKYVSSIANRFDERLGRTIIKLEAPPFLTTSRMYRQLPEVFRAKIADHDLAILKGDVNYRRLFGDRHWHPTTPVSEAGGYFPTSFLSLRTLKAEIVLGITDDILKNILKENDPKWQINGKRGMITFFERTKS